MRISDWSSDVCSSDLVDEAILGVDSDYLAGMRIADFVTFAKRIEGIPASHIRSAHADGDDGDAFRLFHDRIVDRVRRAGRELIEIGRASCRGRVCQYG